MVKTVCIRCIDQHPINQNIDTACLEAYEPVCGCDIRPIQMNVTREKGLHPMWMVNVIKLKEYSNLTIYVTIKYDRQKIKFTITAFFIFIHYMHRI